MRRLTLLFILTLAGCASTAVNMSEPRRVVGTTDAVRVNAEIRGDEIRPGAGLPIVWQITNERETPIAVADVVPATSWDAEEETITVNLGAEVPGASLLPRLIAIAPGETRTFSTTARIAVGPRLQPIDPQKRLGASIRLKVNFLRDTAPFSELIGIAEVAVNDPKRADELFNPWLELNEAVFTNAVPLRWVAKIEAPPRGSRRF